MKSIVDLRVKIMKMDNDKLKTETLLTQIRIARALERISINLEQIDDNLNVAKIY